jgi:hypothetical protein
VRIRGAENLTPAEVAAELDAGGRLVFYEYCISLIFLTLRCPSAVHLLRRTDNGVVRGLPYTVLTVLAGWWGIPMGMIYTPLALFTNLSGGCDVTEELRSLFPGPDDGRPREAGAAGEGRMPCEGP